MLDIRWPISVPKLIVDSPSQWTLLLGALIALLDFPTDLFASNSSTASMIFERRSMLKLTETDEVGERFEIA